MSDAATPMPLAIDPRFRNRERQPGLDLLRGLAIIVVVVYHAALFGFKLPGRVDRFAWIGVDLFFVLSGYLIGGQLLAPLAREQSIKLGRFFARRVLRIMPAYFVILAGVSRHGAAALEISFVCPKHCASRRDRVLARMVARGRRPILSLSAVHPAPCESVSARCADYSMRYRFRRARIARSSGLEESVDPRRRFVPCVSSVDLLP